MSDTETLTLERRHRRLGWWCLLLFLTMGLVLESLHAFKVRWYLDVSNETRRLLLTLAHAHGTLLSLVHLAFSSHVGALRALPMRGVASLCLTGATILLPGGFLAGAYVVHEGDPGIGIIGVPMGAILLWVAVFLTARASNGPRG